MKELRIASANAHKIGELSRLLSAKGFAVNGIGDLADYESPEETGATFAENAAIKARALREHLARKGLDTAVLADDSGLECDDLGGAPGVFSARYAGKNADTRANNAKLVDAIKVLPHPTRAARFTCALCWIGPDGEKIEIIESCPGLILLEPRGANGFGYDPYFYLPELDKTMAELSPEEKNLVSHRGKALRRLLQRI